MIQKYKRLTVGSLDPANTAKYQAWLNEWKGRKTQLSIANSENSGIINYKEVYRKKSEQSNYGISQKRFDELTIEAKKNGATILRGTDEIEKHFDSVNAQAATLGDTMLFRKMYVFVMCWKNAIILCKIRKALTLIRQNRFVHI